MGAAWVGPLVAECDDGCCWFPPCLPNFRRCRAVRMIAASMRRERGVFGAVNLADYWKGGAANAAPSPIEPDRVGRNRESVLDEDEWTEGYVEA